MCQEKKTKSIMLALCLWIIVIPFSHFQVKIQEETEIKLLIDWLVRSRGNLKGGK